MLYCKTCGAYSPDESKFCIQCGNKFNIESTNVKNISINEIVTKLQNEGYTVVNDNIQSNLERQNINVNKNQKISKEINVKVRQKTEDKIMLDPASIGRDILEPKVSMKTQSIQGIPEPKTIDVQQHTGIKKVTIETKQNKKVKPKKEKLSKEDKKAKKKELKDAKKVAKEVLRTTKG